MGANFDQKSTDHGNGRTLVFADRRGTLAMFHVRDSCSKFDRNCSKLVPFLYCRVSSSFLPKFVQKCSNIDQKCDSFLVQRVQNAIQIWVPEFVQISSPQKCLAWCSSAAPGPLPGRSPGTPRARRGRSRSSLSTPWTSRVPQVGPGSDFRSKFDQNSFDFRSKFGQNSIEIGLI